LNVALPTNVIPRFLDMIVENSLKKWRNS